ncbi:MAG: hypothetical protein K2Z81_13605 [Cyanobacteria bacterium]|nr:hypothetical protein [Cyanobacteriota bacterium]
MQDRKTKQNRVGLSADNAIYPENHLLHHHQPLLAKTLFITAIQPDSAESDPQLKNKRADSICNAYFGLSRACCETGNYQDALQWTERINRNTCPSALLARVDKQKNQIKKALAEPNR